MTNHTDFKLAYEKEKAAREKAERLAEEKAAQLFLANQNLKRLNNQLEFEIDKRTAEISVLARLPQELPDPFMRISREGTIAFMNRACLNHWQPELTLELGHSYPKIFEQAIQGVLATHGSVSQQFHINNQYWYIQFYAVEQHGYINILSSNITAQHKAETALRNSQLNLEEAQNLAGLGHWELDIENSALSWSSQIYDQYGLEAGTLEPTFENFFKYVDPADTEGLRAKLSEAVEKGYGRTEFRINRPDGEVRHIQTTIKLDTNDKGQAVRLYGTSQDITHLRKTEAQLLESEERFNLAVQGNHDGIWDYNLAEEKLYLSPQFRKQLGYKEGEIENTPQSLFNYLHPDDIESLLETIRNTQGKQRSTIKINLRERHKNGNYLHFMARAIVLRSPDNKLLRIVGSNTDITSQIKHEQAQKKSLEQLRLLSHISLTFTQSLENLDELLEGALELIGKHLKVDHAVILDNSSDSIFASNSIEWYSPAFLESFEHNYGSVNYVDSPALEESVNRSLTVYDRKSTGSDPILKTLKNQGLHAMMANAFQISGQNKGIVALASAQPDFSWAEHDKELLKAFANLLGSVFERAQAEVKLTQSEEQYRSLVENLTEVIFQTNLNHQLIFVNPAWNEITGISTDQAIGTNIKDYIILEDQQELDNLIEYLQEGLIDFSQTVVRMITAEGSIITVEIFARLRTGNYDEVVGLSGSMMDVTEREQNRQNLIRAKEEAEAASNAKAQFLAVMSHEIRTPLNVLMGISNLLLQQNPRFDQEENLRLLKLSGENLLLLINEILDFNKIEAGKVKLNRTVFNLKALCNDLISALSIQAEEKNLKLTFEYDESLPDKVVGDTTRLTQILTNVLDNAVKFTHKGRIELTVQKENIFGDALRIRFTVTDTGIGINELQHERIFKAFTQAHSQISTLYGGTGLGLAIVERLLALHGSSIELTSREGQGSTFSFVIPYEQHTAEKTVTTNSTGGDASVLDNSKEKGLLIVEDNSLNTFVLTQFLSGWGLEPDVAENGYEALDKLKAKAYSLVLMDLHMPGIDGFETTKKIRNELNLEKLPIIALTANTQPGIRQKVLSAGMTDYISKPFEPEVLFQKLKRYFKIHNYIYDSQDQAQASANDKPLAFYSLNNLLEESRGNPQFVEKMVRLFTSNTDKLLPILAKGIAEQDAKSVKLVAHKLKPSVTWLDISLAIPLIKSIELFPDTYSEEQYGPVASELHSIISNTANELTDWLNKQPSSSLENSETN